MKKLTFLLLLCVATVMVNATEISQDEAAVIANNFMNLRPAASGAKKAPARKMVLKSFAEQTEQNRYYLYENANGEGWVIVAANDVVRPVLAYSETGSFRTDNMPVNVKNWMRDYNRRINHEVKRNAKPAKAIQKEWSDLRAGTPALTATPVVAPLIKTGWDQSEPYWNLCPTKSGEHTYTGCVATAMAQVMNYHQWPKQGTGSHSLVYNKKTYTADFGATTYDWDNMLLTYQKGKYNTTQANAVATLMYHCGIAIDMEYGTDDEGGSGAYTIDYNGYFSGEGIMCVETALPLFFGYDPTTLRGLDRDGDPEDPITWPVWTKAQWIAMLKAELDAARPIMYAGYGYEDPEDDESIYGHSFVCDGYDSNDYFHFNFGWGNYCDGYFDLDNMDTEATDQSGSGHGDYSYYHNVLIGIQPLKGELDPIDIVYMADGLPFDTTHTTTNRYILPEEEPTACADGRVFVGWCAEANYADATTAPKFIKSGDAVTAHTLYAVFANQSAGAASVEKTVTFSELGYENGANVTEVEMDNCLLTFSKAAGSNAPKYYTSGAAVRCYKNNTLTVASENTITSVEFNTIKTYEGVVKATEGTYSDGSWTGSTNEVTFTNAPTDNAQWRIVSITVTTGGGISYTDYSTSCSGEQGIIEEDCGCTPKAAKVLKEGRLVIIRGENIYDVTGARIQ